GQQQRIALARAIAINPGLLLLDEPLSALDAKVRVHLRHEIKELQRKLGVTTIMVTHDQEEALSMADRIVVMKDGVIQQVDTPQVLYDNPVNLFVAGFIGSPKMNFVPGTEAGAPDAATIGIRPEHIGLSKTDGQWAGTVTVSEHLGSDTFLHVVVDGIGAVTVRADGEVDAHHGDRVFLTPQGDKIHRFDGDGQRMSRSAIAA
ncbi:MAG: ABC transporter ATP-binding protein, partial [Rhodobiaceae bacterium]|nr:ABC transporter ATP-binding protein [Rhodobiaceae bacterium]